MFIYQILSSFVITGKKKYDSREEIFVFPPANLIPNSDGNKKCPMWKLWIYIKLNLGYVSMENSDAMIQNQAFFKETDTVFLNEPLLLIPA